MKFFTVFAAILSVALGSQASWNLNQLTIAIQSPYTDPAFLPYLENALNQMMSDLYAGNQLEAISITTPSIDLSTWTLAELSNALQNPHTDAALVPYLELALNQMMLAIVSEDTQEVAPVVVPAMAITFWTMPELSAAFGNPATNPALLPYLEHAINEMAYALINGQQMESIVLAIPVGLLAQESPAPVPVVPAPVEIPVEVPVEIPSEAPVAPAPVAPSSPLVQIIVNVNQQSAGVAPAPVIVPEAVKPEPIVVQPVQVVENPSVVTPVQVVENPSVVTPVQVVENPSIVTPVQVVETPAGVEPVIIGTPSVVTPVQVVETPIAVQPVIIGTPSVVTPVQVVESPIAVEPVIIDTPQFVPVNPVDILHPVPVVQPVIIGAPVVGPIV